MNQFARAMFREIHPGRLPGLAVCAALSVAALSVAALSVAAVNVAAPAPQVAVAPAAAGMEAAHQPLFALFASSDEGNLKRNPLQALMRNDLRYAELELGSAFDVRDFHAQVQGAGALPMAVLEKKINDWVAAKKSGTPRG